MALQIKSVLLIYTNRGKLINSLGQRGTGVEKVKLVVNWHAGKMYDTRQK